MKTVRIIKKYPNRRLYDTELNTYITLEDIKKLVLQHTDLQVVDARTKKDLTQSTLMQIITEQEMSNTPLFTISILQDFIRFYHEKSHNLLGQYLEQAMNLFIQQKKFFKNQWEAYQKILIDPAFLKWPPSSGPTRKKEPKNSSKKSKKLKNKPG